MRMRILMFMTIFLAATATVAQTDSEAGHRSYDVCAGCHGFLGEGNELIGAPRLAGVEAWYLERQVLNFREGIRGHVDGDASGKRMALMAQSVDSDRELGDLLAWIGTLPAPAPAAGALSSAAVTGNVEGGRTLYALCSACHGSDGSGSESLGAPALVTLDGWYLLDQLSAYAEGIRGTHPSDTFGMQMRALATSFDTDVERLDLASFIDSLRR